MTNIIPENIQCGSITTTNSITSNGALTVLGTAEFEEQPTTGGIPLMMGRGDITSDQTVGAAGLTSAGYPYLAHGGTDNMTTQLLLAEQARSFLVGGYGAQSIVTSSRALNTNFTNSSGRPILVSAIVSDSVTGGNGSLLVSSNQIATLFFNTANAWYSVLGIIPTGATYQVNTSTSTSTLHNWTEM